MICKKCNTSGIKNEALGKEFYYCRTCKEEIQLEETKDIFNDLGVKYDLKPRTKNPWILLFK